VTYRLDDTWKKWTEPVNLGRRINSSEAEDLPSYDEKEQVLYFSTKVDGSQVIKSIKLPIQTIRDVLKK
jgi:hypothetical protein